MKNITLFPAIIFLLFFEASCKKEPKPSPPSVCTQTFDIQAIHAKASVRTEYYGPDQTLFYELDIFLNFDLNQLTTGDCDIVMDSIVGKVDTVIITGLYDYNASYHAGDCFNGLMDMVGPTMFTTQQGRSLSDYLQENTQPTTLYMESHTPPDNSISEQFVITYKLQDGRTFVDTTDVIDIELPTQNK